MKRKRKVTKSKTKKKQLKNKRKRSTSKDAAGGHDRASRRKFDRGGRVEAYTMGEAMGNKGWP